jgi:signal transduction histidine kinase
MNTRGLKSPIFLFYLLVFYVLIQFGWWLYLMFTLYQDLYPQPTEIRRKVFMLVGEGSVFLIILIVGIIIIRRAFKREMQINAQQQNFILSITHELKTPITSIKLMLQTLQGRALEEEKRKDLLLLSLKELDRLDSMVANILLTRSIEDRNYLMNPSEFAVDKLIREVIGTMRSGILQHHEVKLELEEINLNADADAVRTICTNLIENAAKYSPAGTCIRVKLSKNSDRTITLSVSDEGKGIVDENKQRVFNKFFREGDELTRKTKGTGLGLFIVKYLVELLGGKIHVADNRPRGTIVEITFNHE